MFEQWVVWFVCGMFCSHLNFLQGPISVAQGVCLHAGCEHSTEPGQKYCPSCKFQRQSKRLSNPSVASTSADETKTPASGAGASTGSGASTGFGKLFGTPAPPVSASGGPRASTGSASGGSSAPGDKVQAAAASAPVRKTQLRLDMEKQARDLLKQLANHKGEEYEEVQYRSEEEDAETATSQTQVEHPTGTQEQLDRSAQPAEWHANPPHPFTMLEIDFIEETGDPELIEYQREMMKRLGTQFKCHRTLVKKDGKEFFEKGQKIELTYNVRNTHRTVGAKISSFITRKYGM